MSTVTAPWERSLTRAAKYSASGLPPSVDSRRRTLLPGDALAPTLFRDALPGLVQLDATAAAMSSAMTADLVMTRCCAPLSRWRIGKYPDLPPCTHGWSLDA